MANCVAADVKLIINTGLSDDNVGSLITLADAEMTSRGLDEGTTNEKKLISMLLTASLCAMRDPSSKGIGNYQESGILDAKGWREEAEIRVARLVDIPFLALNDEID